MFILHKLLIINPNFQKKYSWLHQEINIQVLLIYDLIVRETARLKKVQLFLQLDVVYLFYPFFGENSGDLKIWENIFLSENDLWGIFFMTTLSSFVTRENPTFPTVLPTWNRDFAVYSGLRMCNTRVNVHSYLTNFFVTKENVKRRLKNYITICFKLY